MDDTDMSEDDLKAEESGDSSSGSIDEEIKLNQNFISVLQKIADQNKNYDDFILLLDIAHDLNDLDKIRQSIELFQHEFPLTSTIWLRYLKIELSLAQTQMELKKLQELFRRALKDYYSIELALEYANMVSKCNNEMANEIWNDLLPAYGYEFTNGRHLWKLWRVDYMRRQQAESMNEEACKRIVKKFKEELLLPLNDMKITYAEFRQFLDDHNELVKNIDRESIEEEVKNTRKIYQKVLTYEQKLKKLDEKAHRERINLFRKYIESYADDLEEEYVQVLYERMVASCCLNEYAWKDYISYLQSRPKNWAPLDSNKSEIFLQTDLDIVNRALRNCNWSADLYVEKMKILEINDKPREEVQLVIEQASVVTYNSPDPLVKIWIEYLSYLNRVTNFEDEKQREIIRKSFDLAWKTLGYQYGNLADCDCEILKLWGRIEYTKLHDHGIGKQLWDTVMESNENYKKTALWIEFAELEKSHRGIDAARIILKRALKVYDIDDLQSIVSYWVRFERTNGNIFDLKTCQDTCERMFSQMMKDRRKSENVIMNSSGLKRKADDNMYPGNHKKQATSSNVSKEEFQKLSISKKNEIHTEQVEDNEIDESKDKIQIFLSNLPFNITVEDLRKGFPELTIVSFKMITSKEGKSLGYGYAELSSENEVKMALKLDRRLLANRPVFVSSCERDKSRRQGFKYATTVEPNKIFVKGLSFDAKAADLNKIFAEFGAIKDIRIATKKNGQSKGIAYIEFESEKSASHAVLKLNDTEFMGRTISVAISAPPPAAQGNQDRFQTHVGVSIHNKPAVRTGPESKLSFVPISVQKASSAAAVSINKTATPKSNSDFRKMLLK